MPIRNNRIPAIQQDLPGVVAEGVAEAAGFVADLAAQLAPKDSGDLARSIRVEPETPALVMRVVAGGGAVDYAAHVEYGTSDSPAQPYLTPAYRAISVRKAVADRLRRYLKRR